jgi:molybdate transport repressor ModE-like protein
MQSEAMFDWNDLRAFLAVGRGGSTLAAAKALKVNQTTVARRIEALEAALGLKLFERGQGGSRLTEAGQALIVEAEAVERACEGFGHQARALQRGMTGSLRVTVNEAMANVFVAPALADFRRLYPDIKVEMIVGDDFLDLEKGEADVAIRGTTTLEDSSLVGRKLADVPWAVYCGRAYAVEHGFPATPEEMNDHWLIGGDGRLAGMPGLVWMQEHAPRGEVHTKSSTLTNLVVAVRSGLGIAPLPMLIADHEPDMVRCFELADFPSMTYVLTRADMRDVPRVRAFIDFLVPHFTAIRMKLEETGRRLQAEIHDAVAKARAPAEA